MTETVISTVKEAIDYGDVFAVRNGELVIETLPTPDVFVNLTADDDFEDEDVQIDGDGWELVRVDGKIVHDAPSEGMSRHVVDNPGTYAAVWVEGIAPEWAHGLYDRPVGVALARHRTED